MAFSSLARAQVSPADVECKATETQPECHARLKCKPNEELDDCKKRLLKCGPNEKLDDCKKRVGASKQQGNPGNAGQQGNPGNAGQQQGNDRDTGRTDRRDADQQQQQGGRDNPDERRRRGGDEGGRSRRGDGGQGDSGPRRRRAAGGGGGGGGGGFQANKTFGLGLELGGPTGLTGKYFVSDKGALDFGVGAIYDYYYYGDGFHIYGDFLYHPISLVSAEAFELPFYVGGGLRYWSFHYCFMRDCTFGGSALGIRVPVGIAFDFNNTPLDIFFQIVPVLDFLYGDYYNRYGDREHLGLDASIGIRFWFK